MQIEHLTLRAASIGPLQDFYVDQLGLPLIQAGNHHFTVQAGSTELMFIRQAGADPFYHFAFNIPKNQLEQALAWAQQKRLRIIEERNPEPIVPFPDWNAHAIYFYDPAWNIVEFIARHSLDNASDAPFSIDSIINISEIGEVVDDVEAWHKEKKAEGLTLWRGNTTDFCAMGDENGILIGTKPGRLWYPTEIPAKKHLVKCRWS